MFQSFRDNFRIEFQAELANCFQLWFRPIFWIEFQVKLADCINLWFDDHFCHQGLKKISHAPHRTTRIAHVFAQELWACFEKEKKKWKLVGIHYGDLKVNQVVNKFKSHLRTRFNIH